MLLCGVLISISGLQAQLLVTSPAFPVDNGNLTITFDATKGNKALMNYSNTADVYIHIGAITNLSTGSGNWRYTKFTWGSTTAAAKATSSGTNKYTYSITNIRSWLGVPASETIQKLAIVFRNGAGTVIAKNDDGSDMYLSVITSTQTAVKFTAPVFNPYYQPAPAPLIYNTGQSFTATGSSNKAATLSLIYDGATIKTVSNATSVSNAIAITTTGNHKVKLVANNNNAIADSFSFYVAAATTTAALPAGVQDGINYLAGNTSVTLVLHAPGKNRVNVIGDFNNWTQQVNYQMNKTPDGQKFWVTISGLTAGTEYAFQYIVDDVLRVADPYAEKILDPANDPYINDVSGFTVYPNLKPYPTGKTSGIVSVFQTAKPTYTWTSSNYVRPAQQRLLVYELHLRDFVATHSWKTLKDSLNYLQNLGINAIELLPFNEFDGNDSWGYNPSFYNAPDKYYGTDIDLKAFIDECHKRNIAVIQDIVFNHAWGSSPLVQLYYDAANNRPAANNPWFNQTAPHPYGFGNDFNFSSSATRYYFQRILEYWLGEYKIDGFRFDLSKGFTNKNTGADVAAWGAYDAERVANIKWLADIIWNKTPGAYVILEHLGEWGEENEYMNYKQGMMPWHRLDVKYNEATMGYAGCGQDISEVYYKHNNNFSRPLRMGNLESHDEERLMYKNLTYGRSVTGYNVRDLATALKRMQAAAAFHVLIPGPKMIWQFTELGYDYSINACSNGLLGTGDQCRTARKPIRWDYLQQTDRKALYTTMSGLMKLKNKYGNTFQNDLNAGYDLGCNSFKIYQISSADLNVTVLGNFDAVPLSKTFTLQSTGNWTDYVTGTSYNYSTATQTITLQPGEFRVLLDRNITISNIDAPIPVQNFSVYFKKPANWAAPRIHFWNSVPTGAAPASIWPGSLMPQDCGEWYRWDFSNLASINILFHDNNGNQSPDLSVSGTAYYDNGWLTTPPVINRNPVAAFTLSTTSGVAPLAITSNGAASTSCTGIASWAWNWGNGSTSTGSNSGITFSAAGTYPVKLVVTDLQGNKDSSVQQVVVTSPATPGFTVYFKKPADWASSVKIHLWNALPAGSQAATTWPGTAMTADCNGWYAYTFPAGMTSVNLVFNDGAGKQTTDQVNVAATNYYDNGWLGAEPAGRCTVASEIIVHLKRPAAWTNIPRVYYWNTTPALPAVAWPGNAMTDEGNGWWKYIIKGASCGNVIFNNSNSPQTADLLNVCGEKWYDNGWVSAPVARMKNPSLPFTGIRVYPNPASDECTVQVKLLQSATVQVKLLDGTGRVVSSTNSKVLQPGIRRITMARNQLAAGNYLLELQVGQQRYFERVVFH